MTAVRIGLVFSSCDRYALTHLALRSLVEGVDANQYSMTVLWQDGSIERDAKKFFERFDSDRVRLIKQGDIRNLGAARVIARGMEEVFRYGPFDWVGIAESDIYLKPGWLDQLFVAHDAARQAGLRPGILTPFVVHGWVVEYHENFVTMSNVGAACSLFRPEAWRLVPPVEEGHLFPMKLRLQFGHPPGHTGDNYSDARPLGWDWSFAPSVHHGGYDSIGIQSTYMYNMATPDATVRKMRGFWYVEEGDEPQWFGEGPVRLGERNYAGWREALRTASLRTKGHEEIKTFVKRILPRGVISRWHLLRSLLTGR